MVSLYPIARAGPGLPSSSTTDTEGLGLGRRSTERQATMDLTMMPETSQEDTDAQDDIESQTAENEGMTSPSMVNEGCQLSQLWYEHEKTVATQLPHPSRSAPSCMELSAQRASKTGRSQDGLQGMERELTRMDSEVCALQRSSAALTAASYRLQVNEPNTPARELNIGITHQPGGDRCLQRLGDFEPHSPSNEPRQSRTNQHINGFGSQVGQVLQHISLQEQPRSVEDDRRLLRSDGTQGYKTFQDGVPVTNWDIPSTCPPDQRSHGNEHQVSGMYLGSHCYPVYDQTEYNAALLHNNEEDPRRQSSFQPQQPAKVIFVTVPVKLKRAAPYNGDGSWEDYLVKFELLSKINKWDDNTKALELATSLEGQALQVLTELQPQQRESYSAIVAALTARFDPSNVTELYRAKLKDRVRGKHEALPVLAHDIQYLTRKAYPSMNAHARDHLVLEKFIEALNDPDLEWYVFQTKPQSINKALDVALEYEASKPA